MKFLLLLFLIAAIFVSVNGKSLNCDSLFQKTIQRQSTDGFENCEKQYLNIISNCPDHYDTQTEIINFYGAFYTAVPIFALMWQNLIDFKSKRSKLNIDKMNYLYHRYLVVSKKGTEVHCPPKFVKDWDADYENNMSPLDAGFILTGALDYSNEYKSFNSAERMIQKFKVLFLHIDSTRVKHHGLYWDLYVDFFSSLYKTEHFKTAMYLIMYKTGEKEIKMWIENNSIKIDDFFNWKQKFIVRFRSKLTANVDTE